MPATPTTNLYLTVGQDFENIIDLDIDLTGYEVIAVMKRSYFTASSVEFETTIIDEVAGDVSIKLPNSVTKTLYPTRWVFTIMIRSIGELYYPVLEGVVVVSPSTVNVEI